MKISLSDLTDTIFNLNSAIVQSDAKSYSVEDFTQGLSLETIDTYRLSVTPYESALINTIKKSENSRVFTSSPNLNHYQSKFYITNFDNDVLMVMASSENESLSKQILIDTIAEIIKNSSDDDDVKADAPHLSKRLVTGFEYANGEPYSYVLSYENEIIQFNNAGQARDQDGNLLNLPHIKAQLDPLHYNPSDSSTDNRLNNTIKPPVITKSVEVNHDTIDEALVREEMSHVTFLDRLSTSQRQSLDALANTLNITSNDSLEELARRVFNI